MTLQKKHEVEQIVKQILLFQQDKANKSASDTVSGLFKTLSDKLDQHIITHEQDIQEIREKLDPVSEAFSKVSGFKSTLLVIATLMGGLWAIIEGWKKLSGR